jgi:hypothetical protein
MGSIPVRPAYEWVGDVMWYREDMARFLIWLDDQGLLNPPVEVEIDEILDFYEDHTGVFTSRRSDDC